MMKKAPHRILCWDDKYIETSENIRIEAHSPEKKNIALTCDNEWEGVHNGYASVIKAGDTYRIYYRADSFRHRIDKASTPGRAVICVAESRDGGITFRKPNIGKYEYNGTKNNNIVFSREKAIDNFSVFYDTNPDCPKEEKFKALSEINYGTDKGGTKLIYFSSENGYDFTERYALDVQGTFDTYNVVLWDENTEQYFLYYRAFHTKEGEDRLSWKGARPDWIRDIRVATSKDFKHWEAHGRISFEEDQEEYQLYTNQITKYFRTDDTFIGFPVRYYDRAEEKRNFHFMPLGDRHEKITEVFGREGTAVTDCVIMTSKDGFCFNRRDEAFMTPGVEARDNWWYGNCYMAYGFAETESEIDGAPNEISFYMGENYRIKNVNFRRFTMRMDGFYSWFAPYRGGEVITKPITVDGSNLHINFATSALGGIEIALCDEDGKELEGYCSYTMFGNSIDRPVEFEKPLDDLCGKQVRLKIKMKDAHLYSFCFLDER
jgi:hypothetical protein